MAHLKRARKMPLTCAVGRGRRRSPIALTRAVSRARGRLASDLAETQRLAQVGGRSSDIASGGVTWSDELCRMVGLTPEELTPNYDALS